MAPSPLLFLLLIVQTLVVEASPRSSRASVPYGLRARRRADGGGAQVSTNKFRPLPYSYGYQVSDPSGDGGDYGHRQRTDAAGVTSGQYSVRLPDGRIQTVTYTADRVNGYRATVEYSGEAVFPDLPPSPSSSFAIEPPMRHRPRSPRLSPVGRPRKLLLRRRPSRPFPQPPPSPLPLPSPTTLSPTQQHQQQQPLFHASPSSPAPIQHRSIPNPFLPPMTPQEGAALDGGRLRKDFYPGRIFKISREPTHPDPPPPPSPPIPIITSSPLPPLLVGGGEFRDEHLLPLPQYRA